MRCPMLLGRLCGSDGYEIRLCDDRFQERWVLEVAWNFNVQQVEDGRRNGLDGDPWV
jgi:hypothetical protein